MTKEQLLYYRIELPLDESLEIKNVLTATIWEIATEYDVDELLRQSEFEVKFGEPAIDVGTVITVVVTYLTSKVVEEVVSRTVKESFDKVGEAWSEKILPEIRRRFGKDSLVDADTDD